MARPESAEHGRLEQKTIRMTGLGIESKVAFVTGAGGGIGEAVARALASCGAIVAATDLVGANVERVAASIVEGGAKARGLACDVSSTAAVEATVADVEATLGPIEILVNVAGIFATSSVLALSDAELERIMGVNTRGVLACLRAVGRTMATRGRGAIVTVASQSSQIIRVDQGAYGASKAAASYLTKCLGLELANSGIRCNVVHPGVTETPLATAVWTSGTSSKAVHLTGNLERYRVGVPLGKVAQPEDVANAVVFLASDLASHITMQDLLVDGGQTLMP